MMIVYTSEAIKINSTSDLCISITQNTQMSFDDTEGL